MAVTITSVTPGHATRGASGTLITIAGTGFEASQGGGDVTIGGVSAIIASWSDTAITCRADDSPATPLGAGDVVVSNDSGDTATAKDAVIVYNNASADSNSDLETPGAGDVYVDGLHVGQISGQPAIGPIQETLLPFRPNEKRTDTFQRALTKSCQISLVFSQINSANLALALGGTYAAGSHILTIAAPDGTNKTEHDLLIVCSNGVVYTFPRVLVTAFASLNLAADAWDALPVGFTAYPTDDTALDLMRTYLPA